MMTEARKGKFGMLREWTPNCCGTSKAHQGRVSGEYGLEESFSMIPNAIGWKDGAIFLAVFVMDQTACAIEILAHLSNVLDSHAGFVPGRAARVR
jgi:hypothetical protein